MSVRLGWDAEGRGRVECNVYPEGAPILSVSDDAAFLSISSGSREVVSAGHVVFAREFAEAARVYAEECARWAARGLGDEEPAAAEGGGGGDAQGVAA